MRNHGKKKTELKNNSFISRYVFPYIESRRKKFELRTFVAPKGNEVNYFLIIWGIVQILSMDFYLGIRK